MAVNFGEGVEQPKTQKPGPPPDCLIPQYLAASWKGVPFFVLTSSDDFGRRGDLYEYPLNENVGYVDLGRKARRFKIEGYLIGSDQIAQTRRMRDAAERAQPGVLVHPMYGPQNVACVTLSASADYRKDKKRTKLAFDFIEAVTIPGQEFAPQVITPESVNRAGTAAWQAHGHRVKRTLGAWLPGARARRAAQWVHSDLAKKIRPARDEGSWDAVDSLSPTIPLDAPLPDFDAVADPIEIGTMTVRRLWGSGGIAQVRLRLFNGTVVRVEDEFGSGMSIESLIVTSRLALIRDFAVAARMTKYPTKNAAFADLDFIMAVYDDEERAAAAHSWDDVVVAIRAARAASAQAMLVANATLPGIFTTNVNGVWPSLVVAHKLYANGTRHETVEQYNPQMPPFFIGRDAVAPGA
jgi:hypothetical protein